MPDITFESILTSFVAQNPDYENLSNGTSYLPLQFLLK